MVMNEMDIPMLFVTAFIVGLSGAMMPGPLLTVTIAESARRGFIAGPLITLGHAILEIALIIALLAGFSIYLQIPAVTSIISAIGGVFLLYLGFNMAKDAIKGQVILDSNQNATGKGKNMHPIWAGILISLSNPYWSIYWATIGLTYLTSALKIGIPGVVSFFSGHILADLFWYSLVAAAIAGSRSFISQKIYQNIIVVCGLFLIGLGGYFILNLI